jgi:hypothetical protein
MDWTDVRAIAGDAAIRTPEYCSPFMGLRLPSIPALALFIALAVAGCGSSGASSDNGVAAKPPADIVTASKAAAASASAVHVSGSIISGGAPITLDLSLVEGKGGKGRISENGLSFELIQIGGYAYISGSTDFTSTSPAPPRPSCCRASG